MKSNADLTESPRESSPRVVCELDASSRTEEAFHDAVAYCQEHGAELVLVWVLEPRVFDSPFPGSAGAVGAWGLPHVLHGMVDRAREHGIAVSSAVRVGNREVVLRQAAEALGARVTFRADDSKQTMRQPTRPAREAVGAADGLSAPVGSRPRSS
jgi:nucleotide-binding universal stress UspA family protein